MTEAEGRHGPQDLKGCVVLLTRPAGRNTGLSRLITARGAEVVTAPVIEIRFIGGAAIQEALGRADIVLFVSRNAVDGLVAQDRCLASLAGIGCIGAVGAATGDRLRALGVRVDVEPHGRFDSEHLLAHPSLAASAVAGKRVLIVKGRRGRDLLRCVLRARRAVVEQLDVYERARAGALGAAAKDCLSQRRAFTAVVTSAEGARNLFQLAGAALEPSLRRLTFVAISHRVAEELGRLGVSKVVVARQASDNGLFCAIHAAWAGREETC